VLAVGVGGGANVVVVVAVVVQNNIGKTRGTRKMSSDE
jgi:hypothetical protein